MSEEIQEQLDDRIKELEAVEAEVGELKAREKELEEKCDFWENYASDLFDALDNANDRLQATFDSIEVNAHSNVKEDVPDRPRDL